MTIVVVGLNYRTAPVELREKLTLSTCGVQLALEELSTFTAEAAPKIDEAVILSTCNRFEVYLSTRDGAQGSALIEQFLSSAQGVSVIDLRAALYHHSDTEAIRHLMRVACGLESMILGESQILGQVTQAYAAARQAGTTGAVLSHLFNQVIHAGKRAHTETPISRFTTSVSHAGAALLLEKLHQPSNPRVLVIGAGEMAQLAVQALTRFDVRDFAFINRTYNRAEALAAAFGGTALRWSALPEGLVWADAVICATGAPHTILQRADLESALPQRAGRPLVLIDIAVPRDVDAAVREVDGVQLYDIDDLNAVVDGNLELRKAAIPQVERIIHEEMARFAEWYHGREVTPVIKTLREWAQSVADEELTETLSRLNDADDRTRQMVSRLAHRLVNRLLHEPTSRLRVQASEGNGSGYAHAVRELFALYELDALECQRQGAACAAQPDQPGNCTLHCILPTMDRSA